MTTKFNTTEARALVERLTGYTDGPWREWDGMIQHQLDWIDQNGTRHTDWKYPGIITEMPETWESLANGYLIAAAPDLHRHLTAALAEIERLRGAMEGVRIYAADTLSGRTDGPDDREWQRDAVREIFSRSDAALKGDDQ